MTHARVRPWTALVLTVAAFCSMARSAFGAPAVATLIEGTLSALEPAGITVQDRGGTQVRLTITADTLVIQRAAGTLASIKPNDFVGVTARREADGSLTAISINIFPPEFRGRVRETQFVMDTGNVMTNATVFQNVGRIEGRTLYLKYNGGSVIITVPQNATVARLTVIKLTELRAGIHVMVRGTTGADGTLTATTVTVDAR